MTIEQVLKDLGLQDKESEVYLALLKTPGVQPASVIAKKTDLNRTTVYKTLIRLEYVPKRVTEEIFAYVIVPKTKENINYHKADKDNLRESKVISKDAFPVEIEINIYGQKTAFFSYKADDMFGVILESQSIANSMRAIFDLCWKFAS
jgi:hypothetical protein